jgi:hypothetical protein
MSLRSSDQNHGVPPRFLIIHVESGDHQLDGAHKFNIIDPRFLKDLEIHDCFVQVRREAVLVRNTSENGINLGHARMLGSCFVVAE